MVMMGIKYKNETIITINDFASTLQSKLDDRPLLVGFNIKFDLRWARREDVNFSQCKVWDCQLAEFLLSCQQWVMPNLDEACARQGLPRKIDIVKEMYWNNLIDTDEIPLDILAEYQEGDLISTEALFWNQIERFKEQPQLFKLFKLQCEDLLCLEEMESNGLPYSPERIASGEEKTKRRIEELEKELKEGYEDIPINWGSNDHVSCFLYGGVITTKRRMPIGHYKTGPRKGEVKEQWVEFPFTLPRLVEPLKGSALQKEGYWSTDEATLRSLKSDKKGKKKIALLLEHSKATKLLTTYFQGIPKLAYNMDWEPEMIYGTYNQCVAVTGRLSSSSPNQQNFGPDFKECLVSRFTE